MGDYDDIINLPHHQSRARKHMPISDRAAQFSSFAALTGHDAAIKETARRTDLRITLDESALEELNGKFSLIAQRIGENPEITVTYFVPDKRKSGGEYQKFTGQIRRIDNVAETLIFTDGTVISMHDVTDVSSEYLGI